MQQIGNKLIEIQVTDSSLATPEAGAGFIDSFGGMVDGLASTPALMVILIALAVAVPLSILAIVLSRLHHKRTNRTSAFSKALLRFTPIAAAIAIVAAPLFSIAAPDPLNNSAISIKIDKATALTATDTTTVELDQEATSHVDIYAELDNDFNGNLGTDLLISATNTNDSSSTTNLSTTNSLVYTTDPVTAGDTTDFQIAVSITEDLPVGNYSGEINFYGDFVQEVAQGTATIIFTCMNQNEDLISQTVTLDIGSNYTLPTPNELGLYGGDCDMTSVWKNRDSFDERSFYLPGGAYSQSIEYDGLAASLSTNILAKSEFEDLFITSEPEPLIEDEPWFDECNNNWTTTCDELDQEWYDTVYVSWEDSLAEYYGGTWYYSGFNGEWRVSDWAAYDAWSDQWRERIGNYYSAHGSYPLFDGLIFDWFLIK